MWKRLKRGLKRLLIALLSFVVIIGVGGYWVIESDWFASYLARELAQFLEEQSGESVVVGSVEIELDRRRIRVDGILLSHRAPGSARDGDLILSIESLSLKPVWLDGRLEAETLRVEQPFLRLHIDDDGVREFRERAEGKGASEFPWQELWISGATVEIIRHEDLIRVESLSIEPGVDSSSYGVVASALEMKRGDIAERSEPFEIDDLTWDPYGFEVSDLELVFPSMSLTGDLSLDYGRDLHAALGGQADLDKLKNLLPEFDPFGGRLDWDLNLEGNLHDLEISGALRSEDLSVESKKPGEPYRVGTIDSRFTLNGGRLDVSAEGLSWAEASWDLDASYGLAEGDYELDLQTSEVELLSLVAETGLGLSSRVSGRAAVEIHTAGSPSQVGWSVDWRARTKLLSIYTRPVADENTVLILEIPDLAAEGDLALIEDQIEVDLASAEAPMGSLSGSMTFGLGKRSDLDIDLNLSRVILGHLDPLLDLDLNGTGRAHGRIHGDYKKGLRFDGEVWLRNFELEEVALADQMSGRVESRDLSLWQISEIEGQKGESRYGGQLAIDLGRSGWLDLQVLLHQGRISDLVETVTVLPGLEGEVSGNMSLEGPWNALTGEIWMDLGTVDLYGEVFEAGKMMAWMDAGQFTLDGLEIWRAEGTESLMARGSIGHGWRMLVEVLGSGFRLEYLDHLLGKELKLKGRMSLDALVEGTLMDPKPSGRVAIWDTWYQGWPVGDSFFYFDTDAAELKVQKPPGFPVQLEREQLSFRGVVGGDGLDLKGAIPLASRGPWWLDIRLDALPVQRLIPLAADGGRVQGELDGRFRAWGRLEEPEMAHISAQMDRVDLQWAGHQLKNGDPWTYVQSEGRFEARSIGLQGGRTELVLQADGEVGGEAQLEGGGRLDLELLRTLVEELDQAEGEAVVGIMGEGTWPGLDLNLDLDLENGRFDGVWFPAPVEGVSGRLQASPDGYEMSRVRGRMGGGSFELSGRMDANSWLPSRYDLHGEILAARVQMVDFLPPFTGDAYLDFDGPVGELLMSGKIEILDMRFDERIDWEDWVIELQGERLEDASSEAWGDYFALEIGITADETLRMRNNLADLTASGELRIIGDTSRIGTVGDIRAVPGGRVYLNEREFEIARAELHFIDPYSYDPEVDLALLTDVNTRDERYTIDYRIVGPYSDWRSETSSDPPLPQADVHALLLFGMTRADLERYGGLGGALAAEGGDLLASKLVQTGIYQLDFVPDEFRPDRVDIVSSMGSRGLATISSDVRLLAEWDLGWETTAILEQNLSRGNDTYLGLEKRLARKLYARTYWAGEEYGRNVRVPGAVGLDFNVRWELD